MTQLNHTQTHTHTHIHSFHAQNRTHKEKDRPYKAKAVPQPTKVSKPISICCRARLEKARRGPAVAYALVYACNLKPAVVRTNPTAAGPNLPEDILVGSPVRYSRRSPRFSQGLTDTKSERNCEKQSRGKKKEKTNFCVIRSRSPTALVAPSLVFYPRRSA